MEMDMRSYPNDWVADSIMHKLGVGGGSSGKTHRLTKAEQGDYHYTIGPYSDPVILPHVIRSGNYATPNPIR